MWHKGLRKQILIIKMISTVKMLEIFQKGLVYDCNWTRTQNQLVLKRTLNHLAKLAEQGVP